MQRSTTTSVLLVSAAVAVLALSGCTGVERTAGRGSVSAGPSTPARTPSARPPRAVQAPARDSLERGGPAATPSRTASPRAKATPSDRPSTTSPSPTGDDDARSRDKRRGRSDPPPHRHDGRHQDHPRHDEKSPRSDPPPRARVEVDLCALGRTHGGWEPDSPEAAICRAAYGR
ncbi:hypothetical protein [Streptomyces flavofungini]|uniref:hypothetical protein n=1 Tax=Streptomyces flavofungini TaxID=68200 RepID=UPI001E2B2245|nr:hypothetical protein [Streptomyces flavofungini]